MPPPPTRLIKSLCLISGLAYFLYFACDGLRVQWADDDPMNLYKYWQAGLPRVLRSNLIFFDGFYRPAGGLFYLPLYSFAGLHPFPYRLAIVCLLGLNAYLTYRMACLLGARRRTAWLAALLMCVHGAMAELVYMTSVVYDILCFTLLLLAFNCYVRCRAPGATFRVRNGLAVLALFILAMNGKEMAAIFPLLLLAYEVLYRPAAARRFATAAIALLLAAAALYGKTHGPDALTAVEVYRPVLSLGNWLRANVSFTNTILYLPAKLTTITAPLLWLAMLIYACWRRQRHLRFAWIFILVSTLPISFIPLRGAYCLYIPLAGWALFAASLASDAIDGIVRRIPRVSFEYALTILLVGFLFRWTQTQFAAAPAHFRQAQALTASVIAEMDRLHFKPAHGKKILFVNAPFPDGYDMIFIASLWYGDRTLEVSDQNRLPNPAAVNLGDYDQVMRFESGRLIRLR